MCEGHGGWVEEFDTQDLKHIIDDDYINEMYKVFEVEEIKKILHAMDWKLWEMYQIAKKFQDYFEIR